jgi:peptide/nickel transport system permease protein
MLNYIIRRLAIGVFTLFLITIIVYGLARAMPGTPLTLEMAESDPSKQITKEDRDRMRAVYGLDQPWHVAYLRWVVNLFRLNLGDSWHQKKPVLNAILERMGPTLMLSITSLLLAYFLAMPMGLTATARSGRFDERVMSVVLYGLYSLPSYVAGLQLMTLFYVMLNDTAFELPLSGMTTTEKYSELSLPGKWWDIFKHMLLPVTCLTYGVLAYDSRFIKSNMEEVVRQDYIRTARAKGAGPISVLVQHAFRNTLIPFVTQLGLSLPGLVSGAIIIEQLFSWPGMGQLFFESISYRDYPLIMGLTLMFSTLTLAGQLMADIFYAVVDPRITYS